MKNNKRGVLLFLLILLATVHTAVAQTEVSIKVGVNYSRVIFKGETPDRPSTQFTPGMRIGLSVDVPVGNDFYIQPGLRYSRKGFKEDDGWFAGTDNRFKVTASYIELPVNFLYKPVLGGGNLLLGAGPYLAYGTGGKWESDQPVTIGDVVIEDYGDVIFGNDWSDGEWGKYMYGKPWDYGVNVLVGYEFFDKLSAQFNVQLGLANLQPDVDGKKPDSKTKNVALGLSLGYKL